MQQDKYSELNIDAIEKTDRNPRLTFDDDNFKALVESIEAEGILEPLLVNVVNNKYVLIAGERRLRAAIQLEMKKVPCCLLYDEDEDSVDRKQIVENEVRANLTVLEKGWAIKRYLDKHKEVTHKEVAKLFFIHKTDLSKAIKVTELPEKVWVYIQHHKLSDGNAIALLPLLGKVTEDKIVEIATVAQTLTTKAVREMVKDTLSTSKALSGKVDNASKGLTARYGEKADIKRSGKGYVITLKVAEDELDDTLTLMGAVDADDESKEDISEQTVIDTLDEAKSDTPIEFGTLIVEEQAEELGEEQDKQQDNAEDDCTLGAILFTHSDTGAILSIKETLAFLKAQRTGKIVSKGVFNRSKVSEQLEFENDNGKLYKVNIPKKFTKMSFDELFDAIYESGVYDKSKGVLSEETEDVEEVFTLQDVTPAVTAFDKMFADATEYKVPDSEIEELAEEFSEALDEDGYDEETAPDMDISGIARYNENTEEDISIEIENPPVGKDEKSQEQPKIKDKRCTLFDFPYPIVSFPCEDSYNYEEERKLIFNARNNKKGIDLSEVAVRELIHAIHSGEAKLLRRHEELDRTKIKVFNYKGEMQIRHDPSIYDWVTITRK